MARANSPVVSSKDGVVSCSKCGEVAVYPETGYDEVAEAQRRTHLQAHVEKHETTGRY